MEIDVGYILQGTMVALIGLVIWMIKKNSNKVEALDKSMAVVLHVVKNVDTDHDKIIVIETNQNKVREDLNAAHKKIRDIEHGLT